MYSSLSRWRRGAEAWERKLIKRKNLSLEAHCAFMHKSRTRKAPMQTPERTHTLSGHMLLTLSGLSSVYITYEFWHAAFLRVTKSTVFCVSTTIPHISTWPQQACLEVQASKTTHACTHTQTHSPLSFHWTVFFPCTSSSPCSQCVNLTYSVSDTSMWSCWNVPLGSPKHS